MNRLSANKTGPRRNGVLTFFGRHLISALATTACVLAVLYWSLVASDRYISEAHAIIQDTDLADGQTMDLGGLLTGAVTGASADQLLLRDHLLSVDMLKALDAQLDLRSHYSDRSRDLLSRLWFKDASIEKFHAHYLDRISVEYDSYAGVLVFQAQAFDPKTAQAIAQMLVAAGEAFMNKVAQQLAQEQVDFLVRQIESVHAAHLKARQELLAYQNRHNLASPQAAAENVAGIVGRLQAQLSELKTQRATLLGYLMPDSANVTEVNLQIQATEQQIAVEKAKLTSPKGQALNRLLEEYQRLEMAAQFNQDIYQTALVALEKGRFEAARTLKKMSVLQQPTLPEYPLEPRRAYNSLVSVLVIAMAAGIAHLIAAIIRDHKD